MTLATAVALSAGLVACGGDDSSNPGNPAGYASPGSSNCSAQIQNDVSQLLQEAAEVEMIDIPEITESSSHVTLESARQDLLKLKSDEQAIVAQYGQVNCTLVDETGNPLVDDNGNQHNLTVNSIADTSELNQYLSEIDEIESEQASNNGNARPISVPVPVPMPSLAPLPPMPPMPLTPIIDAGCDQNEMRDMNALYAEEDRMVGEVSPALQPGASRDEMESAKKQILKVQYGIKAFHAKYGSNACTVANSAFGDSDTQLLQTYLDAINTAEKQQDEQTACGNLDNDAAALVSQISSLKTQVDHDLASKGHTALNTSKLRDAVKSFAAQNGADRDGEGCVSSDGKSSIDLVTAMNKSLDQIDAKIKKHHLSHAASLPLVGSISN